MVSDIENAGDVFIELAGKHNQYKAIHFEHLIIMYPEKQKVGDYDEKVSNLKTYREFQKHLQYYVAYNHMMISKCTGKWPRIPYAGLSVWKFKCPC